MITNKVIKDIDEKFNQFVKTYNREPDYARCHIIRKGALPKSCEVNIQLSRGSNTDVNNSIFFCCDNLSILKSLVIPGTEDFIITTCYDFGFFTQEGLARKHPRQSKSDEDEPAKTLWLRLGITLHGTRSELEKILAGSQDELVRLLTTNQVDIDGETYIPATSIEEYNQKYHTDFEETEVNLDPACIKNYHHTTINPIKP